MDTPSPLPLLYDARAKLLRELEALDFVIGKYASGEWASPVQQPFNSNERVYTSYLDFKDKILHALSEGPLSTGDLIRILKLDEAKLTPARLNYHLKKMQSEGLLLTEFSITNKRRKVYTRLNFLSRAI